MDLAEGLRHRKVDLGKVPTAFEEERERSVRFKPLPTLLAFIIPIIGTLLIQLNLFLNARLPTQLTIKDEATYPDSFIGERAEQHLRTLTSFGSRVVGSDANERWAVDFLKTEIENIRLHMEPVHKMEVDIQRPTGDFYLAFKPYGLRNAYANIQNVVVKLSSDKNSKHSVLVNCHYDSVPESPGASDNGLNCAVMLEVLNKLTKLKEPLENNVIFLFNGAEENPLQAAHGFIAHHKWANESRVVVNLDSAGAGGREMLFQTSSNYPWLARIYANSVPHPSGAVTGEEIFQSGIIPSDTDFRIFRDFGPVPGFDLAHCDYGYIYHTRLDNMDYIKPGVYQHTGDNLLALVKALVASPELAKMENEENKTSDRLVFFDFYGAFMVVYSQVFGTFFNSVAIIFSLYSIIATFRVLPSASQQPLRTFGICVALQIVGWLLTLGIMVLIAVILDACNATMSWYAQPSIISILYGTPLLYCGAILPWAVHRYFQSKECVAEKAIQHLNAVQFLWTVVLLILTIIGLRSSFIILLFVIFPALGNTILLASRTYTVNRAIIIYSILPLLPISVAFLILVKALIFFAPVSGRSGAGSNPEMLIALMTFVFGIMTSSYGTPMFLIFKNPHKVLAVIFGATVVTLVLIILTPLGFPYTGNLDSPALQRFSLYHSERTFHDEHGIVRRNESGFWLVGMDRNNLNYISKVIPELEKAKPVSEDCVKELYCGLPVYLARSVKDAQHSFWIKTNSPPVIHNPTTLEVTRQKQLSITTRQLKIVVTGPDHITILLSPKKGVKLIGWSFDDELPEEGQPWNDRSTYLVYFSHGIQQAGIEFTLDLEVSSLSTSPLLDIAVVGHYMHNTTTVWTKEYTDLQSKFPPWTMVTRWVSTYTGWVI